MDGATSWTYLLRFLECVQHFVPANTFDAGKTQTLDCNKKGKHAERTD